jgi:hypothetical protein
MRVCRGEFARRYDRTECLNVNKVELKSCFESIRQPAAEFCSAVEHSSAMAPVEFLQKTQLILAKLHMAALTLPRIEDWEGDLQIGKRSNQEWSTMYQRLKIFLGKYDLYWQVFDSRKHNDEAIFGSLADDLSDIYFDLDGPIKAAQAGVAIEYVLWDLRLNFYIHWGHHLLGAMKAIHDHLPDIELEIEKS